MTFRDVYVGNLDDPNFILDKEKWTDKTWNIGNLPRRLGPFFPPASTAFFKLIDYIEQGKFIGQQTDWGGWVARCTKAQIEEFIAEFYTGDETHKSSDPIVGHFYTQMQEFLVFIKSLDDQKEYALVASEL